MVHVPVAKEEQHFCSFWSCFCCCHFLRSECGASSTASVHIVMHHDQGWDGVGRYGWCGLRRAFGRVRSVVFEVCALFLTQCEAMKNYRGSTFVPCQALCMQKRRSENVRTVKSDHFQAKNKGTSCHQPGKGHILHHL